ncbi:orotidine-5'-phosphate decarboxylase [Streptomyces sp. NPDC088194]|uniref:orotidine-5'-phosphate decarboxylase n=1 Tax=Streptomyces sp. NPDC088194 TaxID=3154931 RepID=UPI00344DA203
MTRQARATWRSPAEPGPAAPSALSTLHVVAPGSLLAWLPYFVADPGGLDQVVHAGTGPDLASEEARDALRGTDADLVVFHSSHETLLRDSALADELRAQGRTVLAQSARAARLGVDKFAMRGLLDEEGLSTLPWWPGDRPPPAPAGDTPVVVKSRFGTQSEGIRLDLAGAAAAGPDEFCESYADGTEYSVLVYRDAAGAAVLPPVWKGATSRHLVPPWRRLRLCPDPFGGSALDRVLREYGLRTAVAAGSIGWAEAELLVTAEGTVHVLEINPRVSGTLRIAALAAGLPVFDMHRRPGARGDLPAHGVAAELPYSGPSFADPERGVFATSRLTAVAPTYGELATVVQQRAGDCPVVEGTARFGPVLAGLAGAERSGPGTPHAVTTPRRKPVRDRTRARNPAPRTGFSGWPELTAERTNLAVGIAPSPKWLSAWGLRDDPAGVEEFCKRLLDAVESVAAVKVQTPFFERFGPEGLELMAAFLAGCAQRGTLTVADAKRCDTADTMAAYADLYLGPQSVLGADAVTVAPFLGLDATAALFDLAAGRRCTAFLLVRTSNHEAGAQLARSADGVTVSEQLADGIAGHNRRFAADGAPGPAAAVVGAPPHEAVALLRRMPGTLVSLPGLGRPGRTVEEFREVVGAAGASRAMLPITSGVLEAGPAAVLDRVRHWQEVLRPLRG